MNPNSADDVTSNRCSVKNRKTLVAITGGIGCGKSVVARALCVMGYKVFDCDLEARDIVDNDSAIRRRIADEICPEAVCIAGCTDRSLIAEIVFNNPDKLACLNDIVHGAVKKRLTDWVNASSDNLLFVETAILYQSGLDSMVDAVLEVTAPKRERILRVMKRNNLTEQEVVLRINAQNCDVAQPHPHIFYIINDGCQAVIPQLLAFRQLISDSHIRQPNTSI